MPTRIDVRDLRARCGLSVERFADKVGVDRRTIQRWENSGLTPMPLAVRRLEEISQELAETRREDGPRRRPVTLPSEQR